MTTNCLLRMCHELVVPYSQSGTVCTKKYKLSQKQRITNGVENFVAMLCYKADIRTGPWLGPQIYFETLFLSPLADKYTSILSWMRICLKNLGSISLVSC